MRDIVRMPFSGYQLSLVGMSPTFRQGMHACLDELDTVVTKGKARTFGRGVRQEWASLVLDLTGKVFIPGVSGIA